MKKLAAITILALGMYACTGRVYEEYSRSLAGDWAYEDSLAVAIEVKEAGNYKFSLNLRLNDGEGYPYSNIWMLMKVKEPKGHTQRARLEIPLFSKEGVWYGTRLGNKLDRRYPSPNLDGVSSPVFQLNAPGKYIFLFQHNMRTDALQGIENIGLRLEKQ